MSQVPTATSFDRYPDIFAAATSWARARFGTDMKGGALRILSFGCSDGSEMQTLRCYFPQASIFGCDINAPQLAVAARRTRRSGRVFLSTAANLRAHGPFDIVFAMSVLCTEPQPGREIGEQFPYAAFETLTGDIDACLAPGGLFCLFNASYVFGDLPLSAFYTALADPRVPANGFLSKFSPAERPFAQWGFTDDFATYALQEGAGRYDDRAFRDCLFEKTPPGAGTAAIALPAPEGLAPDAVPLRRRHCGIAPERIGPSHIACWLTEELFVDPAGRHWARREWHKTSTSAGTLDLGAWWERASADQLDEGSPPLPALVYFSVSRPSREHASARISQRLRRLLTGVIPAGARRLIPSGHR